MPDGLPVFKNKEKEAAYMAAYDDALKLWPLAYETKMIPTRNSETHVIVSGKEDGKPLVLLHGMGINSTMWFPNVSELGAVYRIYALDTPGDMGKSRIYSRSKNRKDMADWIHEVLEELRIEKPHMAGVSYGGFLTINFARYYPELVDKIVMLAPARVFKKLSLMFYLQVFSLMIFPFKGRADSVMKWFSARGKIQHKAFRDLFRMALTQGKSKLSVWPPVYTDEELKNIRNAALLMVGDHEVIYDGPGVLERARQLMPNLQSELVPNCGHTVSGDQPEFVNKRILDFLAHRIQDKGNDTGTRHG